MARHERMGLSSLTDYATPFFKCLPGLFTIWFVAIAALFTVATTARTC